MAQTEISIQGKFKYRLHGWKISFGVRAVLYVVLMLMFYLFISAHIIAPNYVVHPGMKLTQPIIAPRAIVNAEATSRARENAATKVPPVYADVTMKNTDLSDQIFDKIAQVNADDQVTIDEKVDVYRREIPQMLTEYYDRFMRVNASLYAPSLQAEIKRQLQEQQYRIPEDVYYKLPRLTPDEVTQMSIVARELVTRLTADAIRDAQSPRTKVAELVNSSQLSSKNAREIVQEVVRFVITPNRFYDEEATKSAMEKAREAADPVYYQKGDTIAPAGEVVSQDLYDNLKEAGLLKARMDYWPQAGSALVSFLLVMILYVYARQARQPVATNNALLLMLILIIGLDMLGMDIAGLAQNYTFPYVGYLAPIAMGSMLIAVLLGPQIAYISSLIFAVTASLLLNLDADRIFDFRYGFVAIVVCFVSVFAMNRAGQRSSILKAGVLIALAACVSAGALVMLGDEVVPMELLLSFAFAAGGGLITSILVIGLLPFFEAAFGILSPLKLVELSNPNHPLLRKLLTETPGTYHHSVMVGNLSEAAAEAIGANGLLCRVGSFYHDVGKTKRPSYFIENQGNIENPHDRIEPQLSKSIIVAHARDGVEMLKEHKIPKPICDIAEQHHGTTLLKYFYHKALKLQEEHGGPEIREADFRYPGPKAQTKEAAVVGIADSVEAAVRSMRNPTMEEIDAMVRKIVKSRMDDNQFNECDLTLKELDIVSKSLKETLLGIFHSRIEYPDDMAKQGGNKGA